MTSPEVLWRQATISAETAIARMLLDGANPREVLARANAAGGSLAAVAWARAAALPGLAGMLRQARIDHGAAEPESIAAMFDVAAAQAPEAAVALHSLGDPNRLAYATDEIVDWLRAASLLRGDVLDLGCGIGRIAAAIAPEVRFVLGVDISSVMLREARRRVRAANVGFARGNGRDLGFVASASIDLVLAVDSFPYLIMSGANVAARHVAEAARVLRPGGRLVVLNLSYERGYEVQFAAWAALFTVVGASERPFALWDGTAFVAVR